MNNTPEIAQLGAEVLRQPAQAIDNFNSTQFQTLISNMQQLMEQGNGVGIAAPQIGESWQVIIIASRPTARYPKAPEMPATLMVNPQFEILDASLIKDWEGCLSVPGIRALVPRYRKIKVSYQNQQGQACEMVLDDFPARVFQHEFDHLNGMVYLDRVETNTDIVAESEFFKRIAA
jgi:peptide deformylase